jgi:hypothetical protein
MSSGDLLAGIRRGDASAKAADTPPPPAEIENRQGLWRIVIVVLAVLLLLEMLMASRGWRGVANPLTSVPSSGEGS